VAAKQMKKAATATIKEDCVLMDRLSTIPPPQKSSTYDIDRHANRSDKTP